MGWRGRGTQGLGRWPGHGPFSDLPPWQRPGWLYGRGACWWLYPYYTPTGQGASDQTPIPPLMPVTPNLTKEQETVILERQMNALQSQLDAIKNRLSELATDG
jgi:hypothetical protein